MVMSSLIQSLIFLLLFVAGKRTLPSLRLFVNILDGG
jgi:hypothetical protein